MNKFERLEFPILKSVNNPNSIHGIYPYRGKISAIDAANIIEQFPKCESFTLLDPFCGSGTIIYEAQRHGIKSIGVDRNPLAVEISKSKVMRVEEKELNEILKEAQYILELAKEDLINKEYQLMDESARFAFHERTSDEIMTIEKYYDKMNDYNRAAYYGAIALTARGCNHYKWTSSTVGKNIQPKRYIDFYEKFIYKVKKHMKFLNEIDKPDSKIIEGDARALDFLEDKTVDIVFSSPPYFNALDYTAYYGKLIYDIRGTDRLAIKKDLIQNINSYNEDMIEVLNELDRVTKDNSIIIFVVGDKKNGNKIINGGQYFSNIWEPSYLTERYYKGSSSKVFDKLNNTKRKEQIVVWRKVKGEVIRYE